MSFRPAKSLARGMSNHQRSDASTGLHRIVDLAVQVLDADDAFVAVGVDDRLQVHTVWDRVPPPALMNVCRVPVQTDQTVHIDAAGARFPNLPSDSDWADASSLVGTPLRSASGDPIGVLAAVHSGTFAPSEAHRQSLQHLASLAVEGLDRMASSEAQRHADDTRQLQNRVLEQVAAGEPLSAILSKIVRAIETRTTDVIGSIMLYDPVTRCMRYGAGDGLPDAYVDAIDGLPIGPRVGSCGSALYHGRAAIAHDIATDERWAEYHNLALQHGLRACWSIPIHGTDETTLGTFALYRTTPSRPSEADRALLRDFGSLAAIAIERHRDLNTLRQREARFRTLANAVPGVIYNFHISPNGDYTTTFVSEQAQSLLGLDPSPSGFFERFTQCIPSDHQERFVASVQEAVQEQRPWVHEMPFEHPDGRTIWIRGRSMPDPSADVPTFYGVLIDVTGEKEVEAQLERRLHQHEQILETTLDGYLMYDVDGSIVDVNSAYCKMVGYTRDELLAMNVTDLEARWTSDTVRERIRQFAEDAFWEEGLMRFTTQHRHRNGDAITVEISVGVLPAEGTTRETPLTHAFIRNITDRVQMEQALREREEYLSVTLRSIGDGVIATDADGYVTEMNAVAEALTGWSREAARGLPLSNVFRIHNARTGAPVRSPVQEVLDKGKIVGLANHTVLTARDGTDSHIADSAAPIRSGDGDLLGVVLVFRDITDRYERDEALRRHREALEEERKQLKMALEGGNLGMWNLNLNQGRSQFDQRAAAMLGYTAEEVNRTSNFFESNVHPDDLERVWEQHERHVRGEIPFIDLEIRMRHKDGSWRWILDRGTIVAWNDDGTPRRMVGTHMDITERKEREAALQEKQLLLEASQRIAHLGHFVLDVPTSTLYWSDETYRIFGLPPSEPITLQRYFQAIHPNDRDYVQQTNARSLETGEMPTVEHRIVRPDGTERVVEIRGLAMEENQADQPTKIIGTVLDITERKETERQLRKAKEEAETARAEAEEANRLKSIFLANMSHEIRTPLTSIIGFAEEIGRETESPDAALNRRFAQLIARSGNNLLSTLDGVLNLSRLEAGAMGLVEEPLNLTPIVRRTAEPFYPQAESEQLTLQADLASHVQAVADPGGIQMVVQNLLSNALKFTDAGGTIWLRAYVDADDAVLEVEDTGIGMDPDAVPELFEPFRQASEGLAREYEGSGLGLSLVRKLVDQLEGTLTVDTARGDGTRFTVRLPTPSGADAAHPSQSSNDNS